MRLLIKFPSRQRPEKLVSVTQKYVQYANERQTLQFLITLDEDDPTVTPQLLNTLKSFHPAMDIRVGHSTGKIHAINRDMDTAPPFDIVLLASDDMIPIVQGYDQIIRANMQKYYPDTDGVLWFNDGYTGQKLNTLVCCGHKYFNRFGFLYNPLYKSFYCDNEFMDVAASLRRQTYFPQVIIKHIHPANTADVKSDALYERNSRYFKEDADTYYSRKKYPFDVSILICTLPERRAIFQRILTELQRQTGEVSIRVEILSDNRGRDVSVGQKRNDLLERASGRYCCFVDDDDMVSETYLKIYESAIQSGTNFDCVSLNGLLYRNGVSDRPFYHSLKYKQWSEDAQGYYRYPNHLNLIKTWIARSVGFPLKSYGEDHDFSKKLLTSGLLQTEYEHTYGVQYYYYYIPTIPVTVPGLLSGGDIQRKGRVIPLPDPRVVARNQQIQANQIFKKQSGLKFLI